MSRRGGRSANWRSGLAIGAITIGLWLGGSTKSEAANDALLKLLQVLRDRGSLTAAEYETIRVLAETPDSPPAVPAPAILAAGAPAPPTAGSGDAEPPAPVAAVTGAAEQPKPTTSGAAAASPDAPVAAKDVPPIVNRALANKWYERIGFRGYTQLRYTDVLSSQGTAIDVPADRSVNERESFMIRRGRFIFSGDTTDHVYLYAQMDFNGSTGVGDYSLQMRDLYADIAFDDAKAWRIRVGQSKVPFGAVNLQSSQNRAPLERPDALNSAVEGERDLGAAIMWASPEARRRFRDLTGLGLKGSGDYGVVAAGAYAGQGLNRSDQNGEAHIFGRVAYPFKLASGQYFELAAQAYRGRFVTPTQAISVDGATFTPSGPDGGVVDERIGVTAVWYPQPFGIEAEWNWGSGPALSQDFRTIGRDGLHGGYITAGYLHRSRTSGTWYPFSRWHYFDGARKFGRNAPRTMVNELDLGLEFARWAEVEVTGVFTHTFRRTRTSAFPYDDATSGNRLGVQVQWNY